MLALAVIFPLFGGPFYIRLGIETLLLGTVALSVDILLGYAGLLSLGQAAYFGLAAYISALMYLHVTQSFWLVFVTVMTAVGVFALLLGAVGQLQFEVFAHRLGSEFGAPSEVVSAPYQAIRLTDKKSADRLRQIGGIRILTRGDGALVALFENRYRLQRLMSDEPELTLEPILASGEPH